MIEVAEVGGDLAERMRSVAATQEALGVEMGNVAAAQQRAEGEAKLEKLAANKNMICLMVGVFTGLRYEPTMLPLFLLPMMRLLHRIHPWEDTSLRQQEQELVPETFNYKCISYAFILFYITFFFPQF